ncbi:MAG: hypothetical protein IPN33_15230 [Saprospiraceae bacterium]|nr:hypothetical protein [Saprospiraceae bacterium]
MKKNTQWLAGLFFCISFISSVSAQKDFYDTNTIQDVRISFEQKNWRYMLDSLRYNGDALLKAGWKSMGNALMPRESVIATAKLLRRVDAATVCSYR